MNKGIGDCEEIDLRDQWKQHRLVGKSMELCCLGLNPNFGQVASQGVSFPFCKMGIMQPMDVVGSL